LVYEQAIGLYVSTPSVFTDTHLYFLSLFLPFLQLGVFFLFVITRRGEQHVLGFGAPAF